MVCMIKVPKRIKKKFENILLISSILMGFLALMLAFYGLVSYGIKNYPLERAIKNWDKMNEDQEFLKVKLIDEKTGVAFIEYNCVSKNIFRGIKKCNGEYYIFINQINGEWIVNESSKTIIW